MSYSGVPNIIIPLAISVFIVLNTMIGAVYERKREIAVYTSVGLAPSHVSFLFIAEALAFAVLSVVFGYLLAQTTAWLFAGTSVWSGITVNYSSMGGVAAMLLVMAVVLLSAIYPSRVAGQIAIPDVNRSWTLPPASGNTLALVFPFLMTYREHRSVGGFLYDFFEGHFDVSHGRFSTSHIDIAFACDIAPDPRPPTAARRGAARWTSVCAWSAGCGSRPSISASCSRRSCVSRCRARAGFRRDPGDAEPGIGRIQHLATNQQGVPALDSAPAADLALPGRRGQGPLRRAAGAGRGRSRQRAGRPRPARTSRNRRSHAHDPADIRRAPGPGAGGGRLRPGRPRPAAGGAARLRCWPWSICVLTPFNNAYLQGTASRRRPVPAGAVLHPGLDDDPDGGAAGALSGAAAC